MPGKSEFIKTHAGDFASSTIGIGIIAQNAQYWTISLTYERQINFLRLLIDSKRVCTYAKGICTKPFEGPTLFLE